MDHLIDYPERVRIDLLWCRECQGYHALLHTPNGKAAEDAWLGYEYTHPTIDDALTAVRDVIEDEHLLPILEG